MKIAGVNLYNTNFKSQQNGAQTNISDPFLYTANEDYKTKFSFKENKANYIAGLAAAVLAVISLKKFFGRNTIPKSVAELSRKNSGLNKIDFGDRTSNLLKEKILYPMKCILMGDNRVLHKDMNTGLILADSDPVKLDTYIKAFLSHAKALGIEVVEIKYPNKKQQQKEVYKALNKALQYNKETGMPVIVNIGNLGKISNLKISKMESSSNLEKRLARIPKGILWTAYTTDGEKLPYFYNNIPTLSLKIVD